VVLVEACSSANVSGLLCLSAFSAQKVHCWASRYDTCRAAVNSVY